MKNIFLSKQVKSCASIGLRLIAAALLTLVCMQASDAMPIAAQIQGAKPSGVESLGITRNEIKRNEIKRNGNSNKQSNENTTVMRQLPQLGESGGLSYAQERAIGEQIVSEFTAHPRYVNDPVLQDYVDGIWRRLLAVAKQNGFASKAMSERFVWRLHLIQDPTVNAFITPGGVMGVHLGLLATVENTDELASVLAHETSHVSQRHISRMVDARKRQTPVQIAALVLTAMAASQGNTQAAQAAMVGGQALTAQQQINFTRGMEQEADRVGFLLAKQAGYAPRGFVTMFDKLYKANRLNDDGSFPYLRTHPLSRQRMADMQARVGIERQAPAGVKDKGASNPAHALLRARAKLLATKDIDAWQAAVRRAGNATGAVTLADQYAATYAAVLLKNNAQAKRLGKQLQAVLNQQKRTQEERRQVRLLLAEVALQTGDAAAVMDSLGSADRLMPRPETLLLARALILAGKPQQAANKLQDWLAAYPKDAPAWNTLAQAYEAQGKLLRAVGAQAKAEESNFNYARAIDRLRAGQNLYRTGKDKDIIEAQVLDARLKEMRVLQKRQDAVLEALK